MSIQNNYVCIMAGGIGSRFWPERPGTIPQAIPRSARYRPLPHPVDVLPLQEYLPPGKHILHYQSKLPLGTQRAAARGSRCQYHQRAQPQEHRCLRCLFRSQNDGLKPQGQHHCSPRRSPHHGRARFRAYNLRSA